MSVNVNSLQVVIDEAPCTISWVRKDLTYVGVNKVMSQLCGVPQEKFIGEKVGFYTKESHFPNFVSALFASPHDRLEEELQSYIEGECKWYYIVGKKYNNGQEAVLIGIDVTHQKITEQQLVFSERMSSLGELAASIMHEINNPLNVIVLTADRLRKISGGVQGPSPQITEMLDTLDSMCERITKITDSLRKYTRNSANDEMEAVQVKTVIEDAIRICHRRIADGSAQIHVDCDSSLIMRGRESEISQVLINLINNSLDAIKECDHKWVRIVANENMNHITVKVVDSGVGIPDKIHNKILAPFFTTKAKGQGTGLGLSISKKIVENHGGQLRYLAEFRNTTFEFTIPCYRMAA